MRAATLPRLVSTVRISSPNAEVANLRAPAAEAVSHGRPGLGTKLDFLSATLTCRVTLLKRNGSEQVLGIAGWAFHLLSFIRMPDARVGSPCYRSLRLQETAPLRPSRQVLRL